MSFQLEYNARSIPPADIATSFIPPESHFTSLISRNHTLLLGPRGSGKTTLLKMLTLKALRNWAHPRAHEFSEQILFNAAFIPADITWGRQIAALDSLEFNAGRREAAFVIHTLRALIHSMREATELGASKNVPSYLNHLAANLSAQQEEQFAQFVGESITVKPFTNSLLGIELALDATLDALNSGRIDGNFSVDTFPSKLGIIISAFNKISGNEDRRWALLFDEMEIAPTRIKTFLLSGIRSFDDRIIVKLALAPYMDDAGFEKSPTSANPIHDYQTIQLTYPNKEDCFHFSVELFENTFRRLGFNFENISDIFQKPLNNSSFGKRSRGKYKIPEEFLSLAKKDESFRKYADERRIFSPDYDFTENNAAQDIRKVLPIVIARDYYIKNFEMGKVSENRSRKSPTLYTGFPSIVEITEGNPRAILTLVGPLAQEYKEESKRKNSTTPIPTSMQTGAIRRVELLLTSLLQVIPLDLGGFDAKKGLLGFVDQVGRAFEDRLLRAPFSADYVGTFTLDDNLTSEALSAVGKALNAGAFIHVPYPDSGPDSLLRGLVGQRFRISYALASRYRLLLTLGNRVNLSKLLLDERKVKLVDTQHSLFDEK